MKKWIALCLSLVLCLMPLTAWAESADATCNNESLKLLSSLYQEQNVLVYSPLSLSLALSMAAEGADGDTHAQLAALLGDFRADDMLMEDLAFSGVKLANAAFYRPQFIMKDSYVEALADQYAVAPVEMNEGAVQQQVNDWVSENTAGLIPELLAEEPDSLTQLLLINAMSLKADWVHPFTPGATSFDVFHSPDGDIEASMMHLTESLSYAETDGVQAVSLPYTDGSLEMVVLLPNEKSSLAALVDELSAAPDAFLGKYLPAGEFARVCLSLPNIQAESSLALKDALMAAGVTDAFDAALADFTGMADNAKELALHIGSVLQKTVLKLNETGTEAAAATMVIMESGSPMTEEPPIQMTADRPFLMILRDSMSGYVLFAACVNNPS